MQRFKVFYAENISTNFILIWAHCFSLNSLFLCRRSNSLALLVENWKVYGGMVSLDNLRQPYLVKTILLNENYNSQTNDQDIALLRLRSPVVFDGQSHLHLIKIMLLFTLLSQPQAIVRIWSLHWHLIRCRSGSLTTMPQEKSQEMQQKLFILGGSNM